MRDTCPYCMQSRTELAAAKAEVELLSKRCSELGEKSRISVDLSVKYLAEVERLRGADERSALEIERLKAKIEAMEKCIADNCDPYSCEERYVKLHLECHKKVYPQNYDQLLTPAVEDLGGTD